MTLLAHITAGATSAFVAPVVFIVFLLLARRSRDRSERAMERRRRARAKRATVREYWTIERQDDGRWMVVDARQDTAPELTAPAPAPWAEMPGGNGNGKATHEVRDLIAALARAHQHD